MRELRQVISALESETSSTVDKASVLKALHAIEENIAALRAVALICVQKSHVGGPDVDQGIASINAGDKNQPKLSDGATKKLWQIVHGLEEPIDTRG